MIQTRLSRCDQPPAVQQYGLSKIFEGCKKSQKEKLEKSMADIKDYILSWKPEVLELKQSELHAKNS